MNNNVISSEKIIEIAKNGWGAIVEMYKNSTPEQREKIIKALSGLEAVLISFDKFVKHDLYECNL